MRTFALTAALAGAGGLSSLAAAASVEAGTLTTVTAEAPLYDPRQSDQYGCSPSGCVAGLTRDGDMETQDNRWSCKPALSPSGSSCSITYSLEDSLDIVGLNVAMYKGDLRTRTLDIYVDGVKATTWTSSGLTTDFENVMLGVNGKVVELRGVLEESEWLSIMEVEILADDGADDTSNIVQASALTPVTTSALLYDQRLAAGNGCDPNGCTASNTQDGEMADMSRWSCAPKLGDGEATACSIRYTLGTAFALSELRLALYKGTQRQRTVQVHVDGDMVTTWTSSGTTDGFESIGLTGAAGAAIDIVGVLDESEWLSIIETEIMVYPNNATPPPSPTTPEPSATPSPSSPEPTATPKSATPEPAATPSPSTEEPAATPNPATPEPTATPNPATREPTPTPNPATPEPTATPNPATPKPTATPNPATPEPTATPSPSTEEPAATPNPATPEPAATPSPATPEPTATPGPTTGQPVMTSPGSLEPVGLLPLATRGGDDLNRFYAKDGDMSTAWTCTGDPTEPDSGFFECTLRFSMFSYRHIKQVKIALPDGADRTVDMRITTDFYGDLGETFVTSSGTTDGFETYEFDAFTRTVVISAVFSSAGQSISISEVEFVEEVQEGEISVTGFSHPYCTSCGLWIDGPGAFEWGSESEEVIGRTLYFTLGSYAAVSAVELLFPVGETYKFDVGVYDVNNGDPRQTFSGLESTDQEGWQSFDLTGYDGEFAVEVSITIKGTGSGSPGFQLLDARFIGEPIDNPTDNLYVASTYHDNWSSDRYPDFVTEGTGDQKKIMEAICTVKKASFDGVDCVGGDDAATGTVHLPMGSWFVDGNIFMKSGVHLNGRYSGDDSPYFTGIVLEEGAAGKTDVDAMVVMDGIQDARIDDLWIRGHYDPETSNDSPAVSGLGSTGLSVVGSQNITCLDTEIRFLDGDGLVVRNSQNVNIDAGPYDDQYVPWTIGRSRGIGLVVDSSDHVWVRRHAIYDNGVAGMHIMGSNNFTFEATIGTECYGDPCTLGEGEGRVGSLDGQQPIEVIVESSTLVTFQDMRVRSANDPVMTISGSSSVSFNNCGFNNVEADICVIQLLDNLSEVTTGDDPELSLEGSCYVRTAE